jgi:tetratricopeptide (TPR) repeat protein
MDIYHTIEEQYLQTIDELSFGETTKALQILNDIIGREPGYARAHYQLGMIFYYEIKDYQTAGYHFRLCTQFEPAFPNVYYHFMHLLVFLNRTAQIGLLKEKALETPGVEFSAIYYLMGLHAEKNKNWIESQNFYHKGLMVCTSKSEKDDIMEGIERVGYKQQQSQKYHYQISC